MKAVLCKSFGPPESLVFADIDTPTPGADQVLIGIKACGVNFPDTLIIQGKYQYKPPLPFAPGGEVAGVIEAIGEGVDGFAPGDRVIAFTGWGGFAEKVLADAPRLIRMPDAMDYVTAAALVMTYGTSLHALKDRAHLQAGETLLVLGAAGGVGLAAVELGKAMGARVIAAASSTEKLAICREHGADELIDYGSENLKERVKALTDNKGADVIYDPVGGVYAEPALRGVAWEGRYLVVGFAAGEIPRIPLNLPLLKACAIIGVFWGEFSRRFPQQNDANLHALLSWLEQGRIKPHIGTCYPLERAAAALKLLSLRQALGKVVLTV